MSRTCPHCQLLNPPEAQRCDCGYDFVARHVGVPLGPTARPSRVGGSDQLLSGCLSAVMCGVVGGGVGFTGAVAYMAVGGRAAHPSGLGVIITLFLATAFGTACGVVLWLVAAWIRWLGPYKPSQNSK